MNNRRWLLLLVAVSFVGCKTIRPIVRLPSPSLEQPSEAPTLDEVVDLGAMPPPQGTVQRLDSDNWFTPGEWVALLGGQLGPSTKVTIAGKPVEVGGFLEGDSLLVRVPRGLKPGFHPITVDNGHGTATFSVNLTSFTWGADFRGDALRFRLLGTEQKNFAQRDMDIPFPKGRFAALSPEGGILYALQEPDYAGAFQPKAIEAIKDAVGSAQDAPEPCQLITVNMGGFGGPRKVGGITLQLTSRPNGIAAGPRNLVVAIEARHLVVLDVSDVVKPKLLSRVEVVPYNEKEYRDLADVEFMGDGRYVAILEAYENKLHLVDLANPAAPVVTKGGIALAEAQPDPFSIDLAPGPNGNTVYALQGPNLRLAGKKLKQGVKDVWSSVKVGFKKAPGEGDAPMKTLSRVVEIELKGETLVMTHANPLPENIFPFFVAYDPIGKVYVSALHGENPFDDLTADFDGLKKLVNGLVDAAQFSRVISIDPKTGETGTVLQSLSIYFEVTMLPTGKLLASQMRLGPGIIPPRITLDWGFEIVGGEFVKLREVANTAFGLVEAITRLLPPYRFERVGAQ